jgi:hypothetical protein
MEQFRLFPELSLSNIIQAFGSGLGSSIDIFTVLLVIMFVMFFLVVVLMIIPLCLIFRKAGRLWWEALIPFYNLYILTVIAGVKWWVLFGFFIPVLNWIVPAYIYYYVSRRFGFDVLFTVGLVLLPFIFLPILAFGNAVYTKPENV